MSDVTPKPLNQNMMWHDKRDATPKILNQNVTWHGMSDVTPKALNQNMMWHDRAQHCWCPTTRPGIVRGGWCASRAP